MNTPKWIKKSTSQPYFKVRVAVAALLMPVSPLFFLWVASLGEAAGAKVARGFISEAMNHPWLLVGIAGIPLALFIGLLVMLFSAPKQQNASG